MGETTKKNIIPITNGETIFPKNTPNLNQVLFKGVKILEFIDPKIRKINEIIKAHILKFPSLIKGNRAIIKKTTKNTIPKLLLELILTSSIN